MTADTLDIAALHAALDRDPADQFTRARLGDAHRGEGDDATADGLAWMVREDRRPAPRSGRWYLVCEFGGVSRPEWRLPRAVYAAIRSGTEYVADEGVAYRMFPTRRAAEEALCRALAEGGSR